MVWGPAGELGRLFWKGRAMSSVLAETQTATRVPQTKSGAGYLIVGIIIGAAAVGLAWAFSAAASQNPVRPEAGFLGHWERLTPDLTSHLIINTHSGFMLRDTDNGTVAGAWFTPHFDSADRARLVGPGTESEAVLMDGKLEVVTSTGQHYTLERARGEEPAINR
jgi:hypothetical protein